MYLFWSIFKYPPIVDKEREDVKDNVQERKQREIENLQKEINRLADELNREPVEVPLDIYEHSFDDNSTEFSSRVTGVVVKNLGNEDIRCNSALTFLMRMNEDGSTNNLYGEAICNGTSISWSGDGIDDNEEVLIKADRERIMNIAYGTNNILEFKLQNLDYSQYENGIYAFDIEVSGYMNGKKISKQKKCFYIEFRMKYIDVNTGISKKGQLSLEKDGFYQIGFNAYRKLEIHEMNCEKERQTIREES